MNFLISPFSSRATFYRPMGGWARPAEPDRNWQQASNMVSLSGPLYSQAPLRAPTESKWQTFLGLEHLPIRLYHFHLALPFWVRFHLHTLLQYRISSRWYKISLVVVQVSFHLYSCTVRRISSLIFKVQKVQLLVVILKLLPFSFQPLTRGLTNLRMGSFVFFDETR